MNKQVIAIRGVHGFIGSALSDELKGAYEIIEISRSDIDSKDRLDALIDKADVVVNLAGAPVIQRWTPKARKRILESRVKTTESLVESMNRKKTAKHLVNASAIGIYDSQGEHFEESREWADNFLFEVVSQWEAPLKGLDERHAHSILRIGLVMGLTGGAFPRLLRLFKWGLGGTIGSGKQYMSLIHIQDLVRAIRFIVEQRMEGVIHLTAPHYTTNRHFTKTLARSLHRPALLTVPALALKIVYGKAANTLLEGQAAIPGRLMKEQFEFRYQNVEEIIKDLT